MELTFSGVGGAFAPYGTFQTNAFLTAKAGSHLLIDCGSDARHALSNQEVSIEDVDGVYITHLHADHIGGMEWLAFMRFFSGNQTRPMLFAIKTLMRALWSQSLRGGLDSIEGKVMDLTDYFDCQPIGANRYFTWHNGTFYPVQTVHIMAGRRIVHSYGLMIVVPPATPRVDGRSNNIFYTGDTQFCPHQIMKFYECADLIFHDCETSSFRSNVHAHYDDLKTLPPRIKARMWLMHYQANPEVVTRATADGFAGFVSVGQKFDLTADLEGRR